jgi:hypothetical protein
LNTNVFKCAGQQQVKGKPFLRIVSTSGRALGLKFRSETDRDDVLEVLKQRKGSVSATLGSEEQKMLFAKNKDLEALYNQLVGTGILTEGEFWSKHGNVASRGDADGVGQRLGLSSVMHEVEKLHDGKTERVNIHLTPQDIQRIFRDKPEVNRAFIAYVPHSMAEEEFWQKYFKLEYKQAARRKKISMGDEEDKDDIFAPFRKRLDEEESAVAKSRLSQVDPTLDLFSEYVGARWAGGSRSLGADTSRSDEAIQPSSAAMKLKSLANELNRHSYHVLDGPIGDGMDNACVSTVAMAASLEEARNKHLSQEKNSSIDTSDRNDQKELHKYRASSDLADLRGRQTAQTIPLSIHNKLAFLRLKSDQKDQPHIITQKDSNTRQKDSSYSVDPLALLPVPYTTAKPAEALEEFCAMDSEAFVREFGVSGFSAVNIGPEEAMGSVMVEFFRLEALKTDELLRHFWSATLSGDKNSEKALRIRKHLLQQKDSLNLHIKSQNAAQNVGAHVQVYIGRIVSSLIEQIDAAIPS